MSSVSQEGTSSFFSSHFLRVWIRKTDADKMVVTFQSELANGSQW